MFGSRRRELVAQPRARCRLAVAAGGVAYAGDLLVRRGHDPLGLAAGVLEGVLGGRRVGRRTTPSALQGRFGLQLRALGRGLSLLQLARLIADAAAGEPLADQLQVPVDLL